MFLRWGHEIAVSTSTRKTKKIWSVKTVLHARMHVVKFNKAILKGKEIKRPISYTIMSYLVSLKVAFLGFGPLKGYQFSIFYP